MPEREAAICLRAVDYSETSQVLLFLARESGVISLMGKGTKRPKSAAGGAIDLMAEGELVFIAKKREGLGVLVEFAESVSRRSLRARAGALNAALYAVELVSQSLAENDPHPDVFDLLHNLLVRLGEPEAPVPAVMAYFQWRLLRNVGLLGQMHACAGCGGPAGGGDRGRVYFSSAQGGLLCPQCQGPLEQKVLVDDHALAGLAALAAAEAGRKPNFTDPQARAVLRLLDYHVTYQLGHRLKMSRHVIE
ncbi:MAG: DNA repair protein RecO [Planctomycetota bacterium]|nr:DNA repair protein RecO [Planctomycetota bacterium]